MKTQCGVAALTLVHNTESRWSRPEAPWIEVHSAKSKHEVPGLKVHRVELFPLNWQVPGLGVRQLVTRTDQHRGSFFIRTPTQWNLLSDDIILQKTADSFSSSVGRLGAALFHQ